MKKNYIILMVGILGSLLLSTTAYSQADKKDCCFSKKEPVTHIIEFDKDGKIISDLPEFVAWNDSVVTLCNDSLEIKDGLRKQMIDVLSKSYSSLTSREAKKNLAYMYPLFIERDAVIPTQDSNLFYREIEALTIEIKSEIADLQNKKNDVNSTHIPTIDSSTFFLSASFGSDLMKNQKNHKVNFELSVKTFDTVFTEWMNHLNPGELELPLQSELVSADSAFNAIDHYSDSIGLDKITCKQAEELKSKLDTVTPYIKTILEVKLKNWLLNWIWFNGTGLKLNPLPTSNPKVLSKEEKSLVESIPTIEAKINALNKILEKNTSLDGKWANQMIETIGILTENLTVANQIKNEYDQSKNTPAKKYYRNELLYKGFLYTADANRIIYMRNHDASNDYEIMGKLRKYYLEDHKVKYLVQNQNEDKEAKLFESVAKTEDITELAEGALSALSMIEHVLEVNALKTALTSKNVSIDVSSSRGCSPDHADSLEVEIEKLRIKFNAARFKLNWLLKQGELDPIPQLVADETPKYRTDEAGPTKNVEAPAKVSYVLRERPFGSHPDTVGTTVIDSISYKVYALHRFQPFAGFAFGLVKRNKLNIDDTGNLISVERGREQNTYMGIKIYPVKTDIHNSKFIWCTGKDIWTRLNLIAGMDFTNINPVDNFIGGIGADIVPGLNLAYYGNWYKNNTYKIEQGKFIKDGRPLMFDHGFMISLDPIVIFNFAKLIAKP